MEEIIAAITIKVTNSPRHVKVVPETIKNIKEMDKEYTSWKKSS